MRGRYVGDSQVCLAGMPRRYASQVCRAHVSDTSPRERTFLIPHPMRRQPFHSVLVVVKRLNDACRMACGITRVYITRLNITACMHLCTYACHTHRQTQTQTQKQTQPRTRAQKDTDTERDTPTARMQDCGGLMMAEKLEMPSMPRLDIEKVPPCCFYAL
jgi:hypothetical protein